MPVNPGSPNLVTAELLLFIVLLLLVINAGLIYAYRKCSKRELGASVGF